MAALSHFRILLGVSGGIAAYKSAELVRLLRQADAEVRVVMTRGGQAFITPLTLQALSGNPVRTDLFDPEHEAAMGHIELARWADLVVVAPASANTLTRLAHGLADDLLSTLCLATTAPLLLAPAMNSEMWRDDATRGNLATLLARGVHTIGPGAGDLACGEVGPGRMAEPANILAEIVALLRNGPLQGVRLTISAGPTREPLDPVRYLSNHSSGKMGFALAAAAVAAGAEVRLVSGPVSLPTPAGVERVDVETALQMEAAVLADPGQIFIACAAVADYRSAEPAKKKIKKSASETLSVELVRNPDILAEVSALTTNRPFCVGFAAETDEVENYAREKLAMKGLDMIAANRVGPGAEGGFNADDNALSVFWTGGGSQLELMEKGELARRLIALISERFHTTDR